MVDNETIEQRAERIVRQEVLVCLSGIVSTLANGERPFGNPDLMELMEEAAELCMPLEDYEEAARQAGWSHHVSRFAGTPHFKMEGDKVCYQFDGWQDLCEVHEIEPYQWEIFEHWAVSDWLGRKLEAAGQRVHTLGNLTVWGRTTTGQGIANDSVIIEIAKAVS